MRLVLLAIAQLSYLAILGSALPAGPNFKLFGQVIASASERGSDAEAGLHDEFRPRSSSHYSPPASDPPEIDVTPPHRTSNLAAFHHGPALGSPNYGLPLSSPRHYADSAAPYHDSPLSAPLRDVAAPGGSHLATPVQEELHSTVSERIDRLIPHWLRDRHRDNLIGLPKITFIRSPWLRIIYDQLLSSLPGSSRTESVSEVTLSDEFMAQLLSRKRPIFRANGKVYSLQVPIAWLEAARVPAPLQLLVRFHRNLRWGQGSQGRTVTFWSTADRGSELALLGIFHVSGHSFAKNLEESTEIQTFRVSKEFQRYHDGIDWVISMTEERYFLTPEPPQKKPL
ncbi:uncharacterized protein SRS1_10317 [Sporisorium reilianum f. sp. reilianum]|uniref:Effector family protein Eff1 n=1 Tax=Sporisorium reilianum f. sp. reilianum TaxID=72559 RepID=A0A2N8U8D3_9BASI|nr:uncharacterized protein SRS1_10317 [Sporisorium reilianum f. sp. reilianum]